MDTVPDTMLTVRQAVDTTVTYQNNNRNTPPAASQAVEPEYIYATVGEVAPPEHEPMPVPEPVSLSSFPGGQQALLKFLSANIKYPEQAKKDSIEGKVVVKFYVETDGSITNPKIARGLHPLLDAEALRVVNLMPKWESGKQGVLYLPITFKME